jgi:phage shock protein PspC (stress-responsive transcriptional regulator)/predicted membrane protein
MTYASGPEPSSDPRTAPPPPASPRRLYREPEEHKVTGVCGGLADYLGVDPTIVRLAVILLTLTTWFGAILYVVAAFVVPKRPPTEPRVRAARSVLPEGSTTPIVAIMVALAVVAALFFDRPWFDLPAIGFLLVAVGIWLLAGDQLGNRPAVPVHTPANNPGNLTTGSANSTTLPGEVVPPPSTADDTTELPDPETRPGPSVPEGASSTIPQGEVPPPVPPWGLGSPTFTRPGGPIGPLVPPPVSPADIRGPRSGGYVVALLLMGAGAVALIDLLDIASPAFATVVAVGLVTVGLAMVVGAFRGHARWLALLGFPAIGLLVFDDLTTVPLDAGVGDRRVVVAEDGAFSDDHELSMGTLTLDLRDVEGDRADPPTIEASVGMGSLTVLVPDDMTARVEASVGAGDINDEGDVDLERTFTLHRYDDTPEGEGRLVELDLRVDLGEVEVLHG